MRYIWNQNCSWIRYCLIIKAYFIYNFKKQCKVNYLTESSNGTYIHIDNIDFPNFSGKAGNFPNSKGPGPIPKKGCESPVSF